MMVSKPNLRLHFSTGFSLVEIMVAMVIGMLGILVMLQVFSMAEAQRRTTSSADDAETNGAIALYGIQRDVRQGGYGITDMKLMGCSLLLPSALSLTNLAPVTINHALVPVGDSNTDTLLVVYASSSGTPQGEGINTQTGNQFYAVTVINNFQVGDRVIATPATRASPCSLIIDQVIPNTSGNTSVIEVATGVAGMAQGTLFNLGTNQRLPRVVGYAIRSGNLTSCDYMVSACSTAANWTPIANNIVGLVAQYGRDTTVPNMDAVVDIYDQTTPSTACNWSRVSAVRLALVARSGQYDKSAVTAAAPTWLGTTSEPTGSAVAPINLSADAEWQHYRYKTFQTVIPLRNVTWLGAQNGC